MDQKLHFSILSIFIYSKS